MLELTCGTISAMGSVFADSAGFEALFTRLFDEIGDADSDLLAPLVESQMVVRFLVHEPTSEMWVDGREAPVTATFGPSDLDATLTAKVSGNHLHEILLGTLPLGRELLFRRLKVDGSKRKAMKLESLLHALQARYPDLVEALPGT